MNGVPRASVVFPSPCEGGLSTRMAKKVRGMGGAVRKSCRVMWSVRRPGLCPRG